MNKNLIYIDNAATSFPKPYKCIYEMEMCMKHYGANPGRGTNKLSIKAAEKVYETREKLGEIFKIDNPERIAFTQNTTMSLNMAIKGYLKDGDEIIITNMEHNSVWRAVNNIKKKDIIIKVVNSNEIEENITERTKMVCVNHVSNVTGDIADIEKIGKILKEKNICFLVDGAQSAGIVPIDVKKQNIDMLAFPGHKGLLGPMGTGGLYVSEKINLDTIMEGGTGSMSESSNQPDFLPDRLESGTVNLPGIAGLCGSLDFIKETGIEKIGYYEKMLGKELAEKIGNIKGIKIYGGKNKTGLLSVTHEKYEPSYIADILNREFNVAVRSGYHCSPLAAKKIGTEKGGTVRFSPGIFNTKKDIEYVAMALKRIVE